MAVNTTHLQRVIDRLEAIKEFAPSRFCFAARHYRTHRVQGPSFLTLSSADKSLAAQGGVVMHSDLAGTIQRAFAKTDETRALKATAFSSFFLNLTTRQFEPLTHPVVFGMQHVDSVTLSVVIDTLDSIRTHPETYLNYTTLLYDADAGVDLDACTSSLTKSKEASFLTYRYGSSAHY